jgi:hypothetical protein
VMVWDSYRCVSGGGYRTGRKQANGAGGLVFGRCKRCGSDMVWVPYRHPVNRFGLIMVVGITATDNKDVADDGHTCVDRV